jgi:dTDP-4-dehydrorhamnose reductase
MSKQRILVTGSNGQLGNELRTLAGSYPSFDFIFLTREEVSLEDQNGIAITIAKHEPQFCINCAAYTAVDKAEEEKGLAFKINADAVGELARSCKENSCRLIHISTDYVFDGSSAVPYKEDAETNPQGVYGASKLKGEELAMQNDPSSVIIRTSWVYSEFGKNFVKTMIRLMKEKNGINVVNDQIGSPTYAADLADALLTIISKISTKNNAPGGVFHYCNEGIISWYDFALAIKDEIGSECVVKPIATSQYPTVAKRPAYSVLDTSKIQSTFQLKLINWKQSLASCLSKLR